MSAAEWRAAMNVGLPGRALRRGVSAPPVSGGAEIAGKSNSNVAFRIRPSPCRCASRAARLSVGRDAVLTFQIGAQSLALGLIALSLTFLGGYGGMISLAQMTVAGIAGYMVAIFGAASAPTATISLGWPWWLAVPVAIAIATLCAPSSAGFRYAPRASTRS
jgi:branched-chain amino acid transport system permease protein